MIASMLQTLEFYAQTPKIDDKIMTVNRVSGWGDAMSDVLALVRMKPEVVSANEFSFPWSLIFQRPVAHFHIVERGAAWIVMDEQAPIRLDAGDLAILPLGAGHVLTADPRLPALAIEQAINGHFTRDGAVNRLGGSGDTTHLVCGQFSFAGVLAPKLLTVLPPLIHIRSDPGRPLEWLRLTSHFLIEETRRQRPGSAVMIGRLLELLFVQAVRAWASRSPTSLGWLSGLGDPQIGKALSAIHEDPGKRWTVEALAEIGGLSRSAFATRFTNVVGQTPLKYVATWRLSLAADHLRVGTTRIAVIASEVGYSSEAAFTRAFKAQFSIGPAAFRRSGFPQAAVQADLPKRRVI